MKLSNNIAPAHAIKVCAGVFVFCTAVVACEEGPALGGGGDRTLELQSDTITLANGVRLHDVKVRAVSGADFDPAQVTAKAGDVVRLTTADTRTHALLVTAPTPDASAALAASGQLRSPPLVAKDQAWVISLKGVPPGTYTVSCVSHAGQLRLLVQ